MLSEKPGNSLVLIAYGSNLGDSEKNIALALELTASIPNLRLLKTSSLYRTYPVGLDRNQRPFFNGAATLETKLSPLELLRALREIETKLHRVRSRFWGARTIDLDVILFGDVVMSTDELTIPHPRFQWRQFVLDPAVEVAPNAIVPGWGWTLSEIRTLSRWNFLEFPIFCRSLALQRTVNAENRRSAFEEKRFER